MQKIHRYIMLGLFLTIGSALTAQAVFDKNIDPNEKLFAQTGVCDYDGMHGTKLLAEKLSKDFLIEKLKKGTFVEIEKALIVLSFLKDESTLKDITELLYRGDEAVTHSAIRALVSMGNTKAIPSLTKALAEKNRSYKTSLKLIYALRDLPDERALIALEGFQKNVPSDQRFKNPAFLVGKVELVHSLVKGYTSGSEQRKEVITNALDNVSARDWALRMIEKESESAYWLPVLRSMEVAKYESLLLRKKIGETQFTQNEKEQLKALSKIQSHTH